MTRLKFFAKEGPFYGMNRGWGNGYVCIPEGHPMHGMGYDEIHQAYDIDVNGDLTFSESAANLTHWGLPELVVPTDWIIGFDTAHYGDDREKWPDEQSVLREAARLAGQIESLIQ